MLAVLGLMLSSCGSDHQSARQSGVASVAGTQVQASLLNEWTSIESSAKQSGTSLLARRRAFGLLIAWAWHEAEAKQLKVNVTKSQLNEGLYNLEYELTQGGPKVELEPGERAVLAFMASHKLPKRAQLRLTRMWLLAGHVRTRRIKDRAGEIPPRRVSAYYHLHLRRFLTREKRDIKAIINLSRAKTLQARREMEAGVDFKLVVKRFNQNSEGGLLINHTYELPEKRLERDFFAAPLHVLIGPVKEYLFYVFEVFKIMRPHPRPLAEVEASIRSSIATHEDSTAAAARARSWREKTVCRTGLTSNGCGRYES
jgi:hypothetical protein